VSVVAGKPASTSIVIVTYNSRDEIAACLDSLRDAVAARPHQIVVVDNASRDGTPALIRERWPEVRVVEAGGNLGFAAANNIGIRGSAGEFVLLLNPDTIVNRDALDRLIAALTGNATAAVAGPRIVDGTGRAELSFGPMISPLGELRQKLLVTGNDRGLPLIVRCVDRLTRRPRSVDWVSGACLLARRLDIEAAGLFDERFFMYTEDVDLCAAVRGRGRAVLFVPEAQIVHLRGRSAASARSATHQHYRRSQIAFYRKHHPRWAPLLARYLAMKGQLPPEP
jgi:GT2 family glycosyltransferase